MRARCIALLLMSFFLPAIAEETSSVASRAEGAVLAALKPLQTRKIQLEKRLGDLESRQESARGLAEVIAMQKETDQLIQELDDLLQQIRALGIQVAKLRDNGLLEDNGEESTENDEAAGEMLLVDLIDEETEEYGSEEEPQDLAESENQELIFLVDNALSLDDLGSLTQVTEVTEVVEIADDQDVQVGDTREYIDEEGNFVTETVIEVEEENEYYESDEWYFEDPDSDYLKRVRYQIAYNKDEIRNFEDSQIQEGLRVADGKVQKYRQDAAALAQGISSFAQGLNQVQQQMYEQDQRMADLRKASEQRQREIQESIRAANAVREQAAAASRSQMGQGPYPILDPYSTPSRNPGAYASTTNQPRSQAPSDAQAQAKPSKSTPIGRGFSISGNSGTGGKSPEGSTDQVIIYEICHSSRVNKRLSLCSMQAGNVGSVIEAYDKPCLRGEFTFDDYKHPYQIDGKTVYVSYLAVEKFPEAPPDYVLIERGRIPFWRQCY